MTSDQLESDQANGGGPEIVGGDNKIDLRVYWRTIRKRWPIIALAAVLSAGIAFIWTYRQPKIYEASCMLVIESLAPQVLQGVKDVVELGTGTFWGNKEFFETQYRIIQSTAVMKGVVERLGLQNDPAYRGPNGKADVMDIARLLLPQVQLKPVKESRLAEIVVSDRKPERAAMISNAVADAYLEYNLDYKLEGARTAQAWLGEQAGELRKKLEDSELALYEYKRNRNLLAVGLDEKVNMITANLTHVNTRLSEVRVQRIELESMRKIILAARGNIDEKASLPEIQKSGSIVRIKDTYVALEKERADLASRYGVEHPRLKALDGELAAVRKQWEHEIDEMLSAFEKNYEATVDTEKALERMMEGEKKEAIELAKIEVEYKPLGRAAEENNKVYSLIASRQKEIDLTGLMKVNNVRVLERAVVPVAPVRPKPMQNLGIGLLIGLGAGIALAFLIEALDNTLKTQANVEAALGVPVLGLIPIIGGKQEDKDEPQKLRERDLGVYLDPRSLAAECCRSIRTNILFMSPDRPIRTLVVTSPSPREGKTTTAINLAVTMAETGGRVLVVDTDLRRPRLHRSFGVPNQIGISTVIVGKSTLDEAIKSTDVPNLDVLPCGPTPPNPSELLHTGRFAKVLEDCASRYERVILDSPPCSAVTDPAVLGNVADGVILIVQAGGTTREAAMHARRHLTAAKARLLGVILNEIDFSNPAYGYQYYYYQNYSRYGYAYGADPEERKA
ncbi:MAG TPA: polysaccharide biosynthesis tyrosine autokinase [Polyangia bacterium]|jgi:capsular exopolysaccharide synthesis family protein|nr:polysaccharide biosynthesis tyrosine autokinase [Polyangia bacterium]